MSMNIKLVVSVIVPSQKFLNLEFFQCSKCNTFFLKNNVF